MQLSRQQHQEFAQKMNKELSKITMSWDNVLKEWYPIAIAALKHASAMALGVPQDKYSEIFKTDTHGINMNIVAILSNNLEARTPNEMGVEPVKWADILLINHQVAKRWNELQRPVQEKILREFQIMSKDSGLKMIKAEA